MNHLRAAAENTGMARVWLGIGVLALGAASAAQVKEQPPLAAVAKAAQEQKAKAAGATKAAADENTDTTTTGTKYTNEHLDARPRPSSPTASRTALRGAAMLRSGTGGKDESYWRARAASLRQRLQESTDRLNVARARLDGLKADGVDISLANGRSSPMQSERQRQAAYVQELEARVRRDEQAMKSLEDEGRRAGALPGWFR